MNTYAQSISHHCQQKFKQKHSSTVRYMLIVHTTYFCVYLYKYIYMYSYTLNRSDMIAKIVHKIHRIQQSDA